MFPNERDDTFGSVPNWSGWGETQQQKQPPNTAFGGTLPNPMFQQQPPQYTMPQPQGFQQQQQQQPAQQMPPQAQPGNSMSLPAAPSMLFNDATMQAAAQIGVGQLRNFAQSKIGFLSLTPLKPYFAVDNGYVLRKLQLLLFPWRTSDAPPSYAPPGAAPSSACPRDDVQAPDLYIPCMAFVTYALLMSYLIGADRTARGEEFSPEQISASAGTVVVLLAIEALLFKFLVYMFVSTPSQLSPTSAMGQQNQAPPQQLSLLDLLCFLGYKFVAIDACLLVYSITQSTLVWWLAMLYCGAALARFVMLGLKHVILSREGFALGSEGESRTRSLLLLGVGTFQFVAALWLSRL
ncbi:MAG: hypothetical protein MHM6MM_007111 [Cercozoa sp. M6MM]